MKPLIQIITTCGCLIGTSTLLSQTLLLNDTFSVSRTVANLPVTAAWFCGTESSHVIQSTVAGSLTLLSAPSSSRHMVSYFTPNPATKVELGVGESLTLSYEVTFTNPHPNTDSASSNSFRIGLFDSRLQGSGVQRIFADNQGGVSATNDPSYFDTYVGYRFDTILHDNTNASPMRTFRRNPGSVGNALLVLTTAYSAELSGDGTAVLFPAGRYIGEVRLIRLNASTISFSHRIRSVNTEHGIDLTTAGIDSSSNAVFAFDTIAYGINSRVADAFTLHSVRLEYTEIELNEVMVGTRLVQSNAVTAKGTPVVPMWNAPMPTADRRNGAGFPVLTDAEHALVWQPAVREDGAYNHYAALINYKGRFFAMWGNHPLGEDGPGQRILYSWSDEWGNWSDAQELFSAPGPVLPRTETGIHLKSDRWVIVDDVLYAVVYVFEAGRYPIARPVNLDGSYGDPIYVRRPVETNVPAPVFMEGIVEPPGTNIIAAKIRLWYTQNDQVSWWARSGEGIPANAVDGANIIETFSYRAADGTQVVFGRDWGTPSNPVHSNRMYVTFNNGSGPWAQFYPTDIPDSPSRAQALKLDDGTVLLIGNQNVPRYDDALYLDRDPMTVSISEDGFTFDRVYALRTQARTSYRFANVAGRNHGYAYSSSIVHDGWLYTLYSTSKEDMEITRVRLQDMGLALAPEPDPLFHDAAILGDGWVESDWLGLLWMPAYPFVYAPAHGWLYVSGSSEDALLFFDPDSGWFQSGRDYYPYIFVFADGSWYQFLDGALQTLTLRLSAEAGIHAVRLEQS